MTAMSALPTLPFDRPDPFGVPPTLRRLQAEAPIVRVRTAAGDEAWLVTRYEEVRALFADPRLGRSHPDPESAARITNSALMGGARGDFDTEDADHARMRRLLVPCFSTRRMKALAPRVGALVDGLLDDLVAHGSPADLHRALSFPLPVLVICELLGVPYADRDRFHAWSTAIAGMDDAARSAGALESLVGYVRELVERKRAEPGDDILTELTAAEDGRLTDDDIAGLGAVVLFAGHETTVVRIDLGTVLLLTDPEQRRAMLADDTRVPDAVEEILRMGGGGGSGGLPRYARNDIEIGGVTIHAGEAVLLAGGAANHDGRAFADPDRFDIARDRGNPHLAFGYGARYCIGATLARIELTAVFQRLFRRLPALALAVDPTELRWREHVLTGGLAELPVTW
jgi:cytochrome P450